MIVGTQVHHEVPGDVGRPMAINPSSGYAAEIRKHEANYTIYGPPGRPYEYREYPTMMYRPTRPSSGGRVDFEGQTANDKHERGSLERMGFIHGGRAAALAALEAREFEIAELAANRVIPERRMSEKAREEADRIDSSTIQHLAAIPEQPIKRRGRPAKAKVNPA